MDFKDVLEAAKPSIIGLIILSTVEMGIANFMRWSPIVDPSEWVFRFVFPVLILFAGYRATKTLKHGLDTAAAAGALAALVQAIFQAAVMIIGMVIYYQNGTVQMPQEVLDTLGSGGSLAAVLALAAVVFIFLGIVSVLVNTAVGAGGGLIGQRLK